MPDGDIRASVQSLIQRYAENPEKARGRDKPATAVLEGEALGL